MILAELRRDVVDALRRIAAGRLVLGTSGNVSVRDGASGLVVISPSGLPYDRLDPRDVVVVEGDGSVADGERRPSVELPMHLALLEARPEIGAVVHTHSPYATAVALHADEIPCVGVEQAAAVGGATPVASYAPFGDAAAADAVLRAAGGRWAAVIRNHGPVCLGRDLDDAVACAFAVEESAQVYALARVHGEPPALRADEVERVARAYGRR